MKKIFLFYFVCLISLNNFAQEIKGKIIDSELQEPVPFVNIQLSENKGTISNNEGIFRLNIDGYEASHLVTFSSMGFEEFQLSIEELQQINTIVLKPSDELLDQVVVTNKQFTALEIIQKFNENRVKNHQLGENRFRLFHRKRNTFIPEQMVFQLKKASNLKKKERKRINKSLAEFDEEISGSQSLGFYESLRDLYTLSDTILFDLKKKIYLADSDAKNDVDEYQEQAIRKLFKNFDSEHTFKIKIGILKVADSVEVNSSDDNISVGNTDDEDEHQIKPDFSVTEYPKIAYSEENSIPDVLSETKYFDYELQEPTIVNGRPQYVIHFEPGRRKGKHKGRLYIDQEDFALTQIDYQLAEGKKTNSVNLKFLGVKFNGYKDSNSIRFKKTENGNYIPYYANATRAAYVFLRRTLTFIENNPNRSERIKFKLRFIIETKNEVTDEWVLLEHENIADKPITSNNFNTSLEIETIETYSPEIWKDYPVFEATKEMKEYHLK
ncbi:carboxypeptidase-like regulatory domain-containing protein [Psychroflexus planctonicus]|uniref:CarboxypepD_reg-like domain-containing protein n=1 Tax=Psychroflexus planctonicus TaxID=1526575 RepID=A0ABQ1SHN5_9FLAO|nr:carboxypeptidase-like regulatory domain-containing protein [Psychroflexus planctonicus]GGE36683.1 hypothetical protein GCM10010832_16080 [Psychroflexus planctonicus]